MDEQELLSPAASTASQLSRRPGCLGGAFFAGLDLEEWRAILQDAPPTRRPNPRPLAHVLSFLLHMRPRYYLKGSTAFTHTFRLGYLTVFFFFLEVITGLFLMVYYVPTPEKAYLSIQHIMSEVPFGALMRDMHRFAAEAMIACALLHMVRTFVTASYKGERRFTWVTGVMLLVITLGLGFSGYLLPWDQLAYWAITIGTSMAEAVPFIGREVNLILRGAPEIGAAGLLRFYLAHVVLLPLLAILVLGVHYYRVARLHGISLPAAVEEGSLPEAQRQAARQRIPFIPDVLFHELFLACITLFLVVAVCLFVYDAPLEHHADPRHTPLDTEAPWFFLWVQGLLKLGDRQLMGVWAPLVIFLLLFILPYLDRNPRRLARYRPLALTLGAVFVVAMGVLTYMGSHRYGIEMPAAVRIGQDWAPEEGVGILHTVPYDELVVGVYFVNRTDPSTMPPALARAWEALEARINAAVARGDLPALQAVLLIEERQRDLKRITLRITTPNAESYERVVYIHRQRDGDITASVTPPAPSAWESPLSASAP
ncbi:MAG: cytochrome bc complex cytochrome b subunit [Anaerolineae bacterium]|nr:cytochrome bc complex cytochrome b subunit [Anaerolineae bacterium]MDW8070565.1 cytochrome bc complex cytochrome b subunit [Anaerolineae bacterium]